MASNLKILRELSVDRCFKPEALSEPIVTELHHFSDASEEGYGTVSYIRMLKNEDQVHCAFVI